ncbi:MAG: hypothetical protein OEX04_17100 [Acidimicrobiia bacterium]|nr:hypothetical protein [Acidimicrobiia bacterium]
MTDALSFLVDQKITTLVDRYDIVERRDDGTEVRQLGLAQPNWMSVRVNVTFRAGESNSTRFLVRGKSGFRGACRALRVRPGPQPDRMAREGPDVELPPTPDAAPESLTVSTIQRSGALVEAALPNDRPASVISADQADAAGPAHPGGPFAAS